MLEIEIFAEEGELFGKIFYATHFLILYIIITVGTKYIKDILDSILTDGQLKFVKSGGGKYIEKF